MNCSPFAKSATSPQKAKIKILQKEKSVSNLIYRQTLALLFHGATSCTELTSKEAGIFIEWLEQYDPCRPCEPRGEPKGQRPPDDVRYPVTEKQLRDIRQFSLNITWHVRGGARAWLMKYYHVGSMDAIPDSLTAGRVIAGLRGMCMAQHKCRCEGPCEIGRESRTKMIAGKKGMVIKDEI